MCGGKPPIWPSKLDREEDADWLPPLADVDPPDEPRMVGEEGALPTPPLPPAPIPARNWSIRDGRDIVAIP